MSDRFQRLLAQRPYLLADGATGTNLFDAGLAAGDAPELWNVDHPDRIEKLHRDMIAAGADIILTNSFGGSSYRLKLHKAENRVAELNELAARIARRVADEEHKRSGREIIVAGDIGPSGELFEPLGPLTVDEGTEGFAEQAKALAAGGADCLWIETMSSKDELRAATAGAGRTGLPVVTTVTFDTNGSTMMGVKPAEVASFCQHDLQPHPMAYGANCGIGPSELVATLLNLTAAARPGDIIVAKSNCGVPYFDNGKIRYDGTPEMMARYARLARDAGARIIGGCCGTTPEHLASIRAALEGYEPGERPTIEQVIELLGKISPGAAGIVPHAANSDAARRRGRRRGSEG